MPRRPSLERLIISNPGVGLELEELLDEVGYPLTLSELKWRLDANQTVIGDVFSAWFYRQQLDVPITKIERELYRIYTEIGDGTTFDIWSRDRQGELEEILSSGDLTEASTKMLDEGGEDLGDELLRQVISNEGVERQFIEVMVLAARFAKAAQEELQKTIKSAHARPKLSPSENTPIAVGDIALSPRVGLNIE